MKTVEGDHKLTDEATKSVDTRWQVTVLSDVVDWSINGILTLFGAWDHSDHEDFLELADALLLLEAHATLPTAFLSTGSFFFETTLLVLIVFASLHFVLNSFLVVHGAVGKAGTEGLFDELASVIVLNQLQLDLLVESGQEVRSHGELLTVAEEANVLELRESIALEVRQELLGHVAGDIALLRAFVQSLSLSNLVGASVDLVIAAGLASLNSLRLNEHSLALLLVLSVMLMKNKVLMGLDHLDAGLLKRFTDEHLEDGLDLEVKVEQVRVDVLDLNGLIIAFFIGDVGGGRRAIDIVVRFDLRLVNHVVAVIKFLPIVVGLHLHLLLVHLGHLLLLLRVLIVAFVHSTIHLLLHSLVLFLFLSVNNGYNKSAERLTFIFYSLLRRYMAAFFYFSTLMGSGCMLTGMTSAAKVLPRTTRRSYMIF